MSPEQCHSEKLDARADLYSLACVMFASLYGTTPYNSDNEMEIILKHASAETPQLPHNAAVPPHIESLLQSCLSKNREDRPPSAAAVLASLQSEQGVPHAVRRNRRLNMRMIGRRFALVGFMLALLLAGISMITFWVQQQPNAPSSADAPIRPDSPAMLIRKGQSAHASGCSFSPPDCENEQTRPDQSTVSTG